MVPHQRLITDVKTASDRYRINVVRPFRMGIPANLIWPPGLGDRFSQDGPEFEFEPNLLILFKTIPQSSDADASQSDPRSPLGGTASGNHR